MTIQTFIEDNFDFQSLNPPVHKASTVVFSSMEELRNSHVQTPNRITYGLHNTPTSLHLLSKLCAIEQCDYGCLTPSGLSAIHLVYMTCLKPNGHILIMNTVYDPTRHIGDWLKRFCPDLEIEFFPPTIGGEIHTLIRPNTCLIWLESPGSITMEVADIPAICKAAQHYQVPTALDNTWSAGIYFKPFDHGVDFSIQALTKYQSGGSDILMGAVLTQSREHYQALISTHRHMGLGVSADDCYNIGRGLDSLKVRLDAQGKNSLWIANQLQGHPAIYKILHPAHPDCIGHNHWRDHFTGSSSLFSILLQSSFQLSDADHVVNSLKRFKIGFSWGGSHSLALATRPSMFRTDKMKIEPIFEADSPIIRLYIGLEEPETLLADLMSALNKIAAQSST